MYISKRSGMDHTVLPANTPCLHFLVVSVHQMAIPLTELTDIQLQLTTHLSTRIDKRLIWPGGLTYSGRFTHISSHPSATWSSAGQGKFAGQRPMFYHCATLYQAWWRAFRSSLGCHAELE